jgi:outer membrane protein
MKKSIVLILAVVLMGAAPVLAQQKIGHINSGTVIQAMPEYKLMTDDLTKKRDELYKVLETMYGEFDKKQKELQDLSNAAGTSNAILDMKVQELQDLQKRITAFEEKINDDLQKMQEERLKPIQDKFNKAVKEIATSSGYSYILDISTVVYYTEGQNDVTDLVLKKLGLTAPAPTTPK